MERNSPVCSVTAPASSGRKRRQAAAMDDSSSQSPHEHRRCPALQMQQLEHCDPQARGARKRQRVALLSVVCTILMAATSLAGMLCHQNELILFMCAVYQLGGLFPMNNGQHNIGLHLRQVKYRIDFGALKGVVTLLLGNLMALRSGYQL